MAPEIIEGLGYTFNVDIYSIGVCFYEFICGFLPFGEDLEDPFAIYQEIMNSPKIKFPKMHTNDVFFVNEKFENAQKWWNFPE